MTRRIGIAFLAMTAWILVLGLALQPAPAAAARSGYRFLDQFSNGGYGGNYGNTDFASAWWEYHDKGGPAKGAVSVESGGNCPDDRCVRIFGDDEQFQGTGLARRAIFVDAATATLRFEYRLDIHNATGGRFDVAVFDGYRWTILESFALDDPSDNETHSRTYNVIDYAAHHFYVGFFAHGHWDAEVSIDNVEIFGDRDTTTTTTTTTETPTTTTHPPTTTSTTSTTSTTAPPNTTTSTTQPSTSPTTTTSTTTMPTTTTRPPTVTTLPPATTVAPTPTTAGPTTAGPTTTTTRPPAPEPPLVEDERYTLKGELAMLIDDDLVAIPLEVADIPPLSPVTQIAATVTTTAVTVRSHLLPASALGLLIAVAAVFGLGKLEKPTTAAAGPEA